MIGGFTIKYDKAGAGLRVEVWRTNGRVTSYEYTQHRFDRICAVTRGWTDGYFSDRIVTRKRMA